MKKTISFIAALTVLLSCSSMTAFADTSPVPADIPSAAYKQLLSNQRADKNNDGIITEEEFSSVSSISLDMDGIDSVEFLTRLEAPRAITLSGGSISDLSPLKKIKGLDTLALSKMKNVTDISFAKEMGLKTFILGSMPQITDEQKIAVYTFHDADVYIGDTALAGASPVGMFGTANESVEIIGEPNADFSNKTTTTGSAGYVIGKMKGSAEYAVKVNDKEIHRGTIKVSASEPTVLDSDSTQSMQMIMDSAYYSAELVLKDNTLYKLANGSKEKVDENVTDMNSTYYDQGKFDYVRIETFLYKDGTIKVNGKDPANAEGLTFTVIYNGYCVTDSGDVYRIYRDDEEYRLELLYSGFGRFMSNYYFESDKGEIIYIYSILNENNSYSYKALETGIMNVTSYSYNYFVDSNNVMWYIDTFDKDVPKVTKRAENIKFIGTKYVDEEHGNKFVRITTDGKAYLTDSDIEVTLTEKTNNDKYIKDMGFIRPFSPPKDGPSVKGIQFIGPMTYDYCISYDGTLFLNYKGDHTSAADVRSIVTLLTDEETDKEYLLLRKTDDTLWYYSLDDKVFSSVFAESSQPAKVKGDVNSDGVFSVADAVLLQKWLLAVPDTKLADCNAADLCEDNSLDVFDLCVMKKMLVSSSDDNE